MLVVYTVEELGTSRENKNMPCFLCVRSFNFLQKNGQILRETEAIWHAKCSLHIYREDVHVF